MNFIAFRRSFVDLVCVSTDQIEALYPTFDRLDLARWVKKGLITKLKHRHYTFPELATQPEVPLYISNLLYKPSYISLHSALAFYGIIPKAPLQITAISTMPSMVINNDLGSYRYKKVSENVFFGYESKSVGGRTILLADPEKAVLDLLLLYPIYKLATELKELRLDKKLIRALNIERLDAYAARFDNKTIAQRLALLKKTYAL